MKDVYIFQFLRINALRKMTLNFSFKKYFYFEYVLLSIFGGLWPSKVTKRFERNQKVFWSLIIMLCIIPMVIFEAGSIIVYQVNLKDFTDRLHIAITMFLAVYKLYFIITKRNQFKEIFTILFTNIIFTPKTEEERNMTEKAFRVYYILRYTVIFCPYAVLLLGVFNDIEVNNYLPFPCWYPFDTSRSPIHEIAFIHQIFTFFSAGTAVLVLEITMVGLTSFIALQCDFICQRLENLTDEKSLIEIIKVHQEVVR